MIIDSLEPWAIWAIDFCSCNWLVFEQSCLYFLLVVTVLVVLSIQTWKCFFMVSRKLSAIAFHPWLYECMCMCMCMCMCLSSVNHFDQWIFARFCFCRSIYELRIIIACCSFFINQGRIHGIRRLLACADSSFGQKRHFCMVTTHVWRTDGRTDGRTDRRTDRQTGILIKMRERI